MTFNLSDSTFLSI